MEVQHLVAAQVAIEGLSLACRAGTFLGGVSLSSFAVAVPPAFLGHSTLPMPSRR